MDYHLLYKSCQKVHEVFSRGRFIPVETIDDAYDSTIDLCFLKMTIAQVSKAIGIGVDITGISFVLDTIALAPVLTSSWNTINKTFDIPEISTDDIDFATVRELLSLSVDITKTIIRARYDNLLSGGQDKKANSRIKNAYSNYVNCVSKGSQIYALTIAYIESLALNPQIQSLNEIVKNIKQFITQHTECYLSYVQEFHDDSNVKYRDFFKEDNLKDNSIEAITADLKKSIEKSFENDRNRIRKNEELICKILDKACILDSFEARVLNQDLSQYIVALLYKHDVKLKEVLGKHVSWSADFLGQYAFCKELFKTDEISILNKYLQYCIISFPYEIDNQLRSPENITLYAYIKEAYSILNWNNRLLNCQIVDIDYSFLTIVSMMMVEIVSLEDENIIESDVLQQTSEYLIDNFLDIFSTPMSWHNLEIRIRNTFPKIGLLKPYFPMPIQIILDDGGKDESTLAMVAFLYYAWNTKLKGIRKFDSQNEIISLIGFYYNKFNRYILMK